MLTREERIEGYKNGYFMITDIVRRKEIKADLKRDPDKVKICAHPDSYHKAVFVTRTGGFHYDTGQKAKYDTKGYCERLMKQRIKESKHKMIPPQEFYAKISKEIQQHDIKGEAFTVWMGAYQAKLSQPHTSTEMVPVKFFVEIEDGTKKGCDKSFEFHVSHATHKTVMIKSTRFKFNEIKDIAKDLVWAFPFAIGTTSAWLNHLYTIIRKEIFVENSPREIWLKFMSLAAAKRVHQYLFDKPLDTQQIIHCIEETGD